MKAIVALCVVALAACVTAEQCSNVGDCQETLCKQQDGWWLHCMRGYCICNHDTFTGHPCADGLSTTCDAAHGSRCQDNNLHWRCIDNQCHCTKL